MNQFLKDKTWVAKIKTETWILNQNIYLYILLMRWDHNTPRHTHHISVPLLVSYIDTVQSGCYTGQNTTLGDYSHMADNPSLAPDPSSWPVGEMKTNIYYRSSSFHFFSYHIRGHKQELDQDDL